MFLLVSYFDTIPSLRGFFESHDTSVILFALPLPLVNIIKDILCNNLYK
jgi:hypothetical protein